MTATYNQFGEYLYGIYRGDMSGPDTTINYKDSTDFDLFAMPISAGDCIYFCGRGGNNQVLQCYDFRGLRFDLSQALVADEAEVVWEYYTYLKPTGWGWYEFDGLSDGTNGFTSEGQHDVDWLPPAVWRTASFGGILRAHWCRARIVSITNPTQAPRQGGKVLAGNNTIVITGTETLSSVLLQHDAGGWGVIDCLVPGGDAAIMIRAALQFGDGVDAGSFSDTRRCYILTRAIEIKSNYTVTFGTLAGELELGNWGCALLLAIDEHDGYWMFLKSGAVLNLFGSFLCDLYSGDDVFGVVAGAVLNIRNSIIRNGGYFTVPPGSEVFGSTLYGRYDRVALYGNTERSFVKGLNLAGWMGPSTELREMEVEGILIENWTGPFALYMINAPRIVQPTFGGHLGYDSDLQVYYVYEFRLTVEDPDHAPIEGARVEIVNALGDTVWAGETDEKGEIPLQELVYRHYYWNGVETGGQTVITDYSPYTVRLSAPGYETRMLYLNMDRKREEVEVLEAYVPEVTAKISSKTTRATPSGPPQVTATVD